MMFFIVFHFLLLYFLMKFQTEKGTEPVRASEPVPTDSVQTERVCEHNFVVIFV